MWKKKINGFDKDVGFFLRNIYIFTVDNLLRTRYI